MRLLVRTFKGRGGGSRWAWPIGAVIVRREQVGVADLSGLCRAALEGTADSFKAMQGGSWRHGGSLRTTQGQRESMADASGLCTEGAGGRGGSLRAMQGGSGGSCRSCCSAVDADVGVSKRAGLMPRLWFLRKGCPHWWKVTLACEKGISVSASSHALDIHSSCQAFVGKKDRYAKHHYTDGGQGGRMPSIMNVTKITTS